MRPLFVTRFPNEDTLHFRDTPVWPARTRHERALLARIARAFGGRLDYIDAGRLSHGDSLLRCDEIVVGLGPETDAPATLYAHLTGRTPVVVSDERSCVALDRITVVVTLYERLTPSLLDALAARCGSVLPGIITAHDTTSLRSQVLAKSAAATLCGSIDRHEISIHPLAVFEPHRSRRRVQLGMGTPDPAIRRALTSHCGVLTIDTHSDGVDAFLGTALTLCPLGTRPKATGQREPYCLTTRVCHRQNVGISAAWRQGLLVSPAAIRARVLIFNTCRGLLLPRGQIDPRWGLVRSLLDRNTVGAILLSWEMSFPTSAETNTVSRLIAQGMPVGEAAAMALREPRSVRLNERMCLLGDPRTRAVPRQPVSRAATLSGQPPSEGDPEPPRTDISHLRFARRCVALGTAGGRREKRDAARAARSALRRYTDAARMGKGEYAEGPFRQALLEYLLRRGELFEDWSTVGGTFRGMRGGTCAQCGVTLKRYVFRFARRAYPSRALDTCAHCEIVRDAPLGVDLAVTIADGRTIQLEGTLPRSHWAAGLLLSSWREDRIWPWPASADGSPARSFVPPGGVPARHVYALLLLVDRWSIVMLRASGQGTGSVVRFLQTTGWTGPAGTLHSGTGTA